MIMTQDLQQALQRLVRGDICFNEPMREHTTIKIGGPADIWVEPADIDDLACIIRFTEDNAIPRTVFGNGSNTLVRDRGVRGVVISLAKLNDVTMISPTEIRAGGGALLHQLVSRSVESSLSGLECLVGIPGTVGGALIMNAGTGDGTIGDSVKNITYMTKNRTVTAEKEDLEFGYRKLKLPKGSVIVGAEFVLRQGDRPQIEERIAKIRKHRGEVQPLIWPSIGSIFKNPEKRKAWQLIDDAGLRGIRVGGARVANEHANWIINEGNATAKDVEVLIRLIKEKVKDKTGVSLETEIIITGE